jgi:hypothetical protein
LIDRLDDGHAMNDLAPVLGVLAGLAGIADTIPYVRDTLRGSTRPHRGSWLIWGALAIIACIAQRADGATWSVLMAGTQAIVTGLVFLIAIRYGEGGMSAIDLGLMTLAAAGVVGWIVAREPVIALACVIAADLSALAMMTPKVHRDPHSETLSTYVLASVGGALAAGAVSQLDVAMLLYPVYYSLVNAATAILIGRRRAILVHRSGG